MPRVRASIRQPTACRRHDTAHSRDVRGRWTTTRRGRRHRPGRRSRHPDAVRHPQGAAHAGRPQHALARAARHRQGRTRSTWWSSSARTASTSSPAVDGLADDLGRTIDIAVQDEQLGTGHAVGCGLAALPDDFAGTVVVTAGDVPLLDADTLAELIDAHGAEPAAATRADHDAARPDRLRPHPAHAGRRGHQHRRAGRRHGRRSGRSARSTPAVYAFDAAALRSALSRAALRQRPAASSTSPTPSRSCASDGQRGAGRARRRQRAGRRGQRPRPAGRAAPPSSTGASSRAISARRHRHRPGHHVDRRRRHRRPRHRRSRPGTQLLGATAHRRAAARSGPTPR